MLMSHRLLVVIALCGVASVGVAQRPAIPTTEAGGGPERTTALNGRVFRALIQPMNGSTVTGTVAMMPSQEDGLTTITVSIVGANPGTYYWHIHVGRCSEPGALLGDRTEYKPIQVDATGRATVRVDLSVPPPSGGNYHVVLHESSDPKNESHIVACGELLETGV
jgi:hypothetical protein